MRVFSRKGLGPLLCSAAAALSITASALADPAPDTAANAQRIASLLQGGNAAVQYVVFKTISANRSRPEVQAALKQASLDDASGAAFSTGLYRQFKDSPRPWAQLYVALQGTSPRPAAPSSGADAAAGTQSAKVNALTRQIGLAKDGLQARLDQIFDNSNARPAPASPAPAIKSDNWGGAKPPSSTVGNGSKITFDDVVGIDEAKAELMRIVNMAKHPERYRRAGAQIPTGVIMYGPPGTGKTYSARALANESDMCFISVSASELINKYVGESANKVRELFAQAREKAPCIVFIDEIDALGRRVDVEQGADKEINGAITQLLVEMDGLTDSQDGSKPLVIVVGATNRLKDIDPALLRPGRFDLKVPLNLPDVAGRLKVLQLYVAKRKVPVAPDVDLQAIAQQTTGMSPADLVQLINRAATKGADEATSDDKVTVTMKDFTDALDETQIGSARKLVMTDKDKRETAIHELGHAIVGYFAPNGDPIGKITIIPRTSGALGVTTEAEGQDKLNYTEAELEHRIAMAMGGRVAEKLFTGDYTTGASSDLENAENLAYKMVVLYGMSDKLGPVSFGETQQDSLGDGQRVKAVSDATKKEIEDEVHRIETEQEARATQILTQHKNTLMSIVPILVEKETLSGDEFAALVKQFEGANLAGTPPPPGPGGAGGSINARNIGSSLR